MDSQALFLRDYALNGDLSCCAYDIAFNFFDTGQHMKIVHVLTTMVFIHKSDKGILEEI